ncbi:hypothetical protein ACN23B_18285 [Anabaena sp. FACHB-709]|uniref:Uncharacterized protein n=2 Tax=Nostocaceae TaxID=1162 RepID=A0A1Z4KJW8_ANAVA|nr:MULTISPECIES: hypothetical protein [Nostocaceae]RUR74586.1 hypothetical protein DSM107007_50910 [Nostoc sp. PCC 7120 = FACHB-418]BAY69268.1 hypothetical protein NIES23_20620 [Trichormus variabilis NIES-23]
MWKAGTQQQAIPSPDHANRYLRDIKEGKGFPSLWLASCSEDLEKIALGMLLLKGHLDTVNFIGFKESCFSNVGLIVNHVKDTSFPISGVGNLHYELCTSDDTQLIPAIELFLKGNGFFEEFVKSQPDKNNMRKIAARYINEVNQQYQAKAIEWGKQYLE